ncbi:aspartate aminotransferase family protein [Coralliovum pocilloporae]|uniref:aminotransferase family protein n=1 Tax=Coralliovum pocilloporae TaxID=3066369 RepID=UPI003306F57A
MQNILHPATSIQLLEETGPRVMQHASGMHVIDQDGNRLIDGTAGLWCSNVGHGRKEIGEAMQTAVSELDYFHTFNGFSNAQQIRLSERLADLAPAGLNHVFFGSSGSDANDTLIKILWHYNVIQGRPEKKKVIARWQAYHGTSISTASLTGLPGFHKGFHLPLDFVVHVSCPHFYRYGQEGETEAAYTARLLRELEETIEKEGAETIAGFIGEPIIGAGGVITPPEGYWAGVQEICRKHDILIIADEVVSGYGRTGSMFACPELGIKPDMMTTAKGLTAGTFPYSAAFVSDQIHDVLRKGSELFGAFAHGYTYSGHPVGAAVANTVLDIIEQDNLIENARTVGTYLHQELQKLADRHPNIGEIRGRGLLAGIQLVTDKETKTLFETSEKMPGKLSEACYRKGLIIRPLPTVSSLALSPPLIMTKANVDATLEILADGLETIFGKQA